MLQRRGLFLVVGRFLSGRPSKLVTADEAIKAIKPGDTVANAGFVGTGTPDALIDALARRFKETGTPTDLTLVFAAGQGDGKGFKGLNLIAQEKLLAKAIGGHFGMAPKLGQLALQNKIEAYNLPQGIISHLYRAIAAGSVGVISHVGLGTFVDPRLEGGKINKITAEDMVEVIKIAGKERLFYKAFPINVAFIRGTTADEFGNVSMEHEALTLDNLAMAMAAKNSGGKVIVQVERLVKHGFVPPRTVKIPGAIVDYVVVAPPELHPQTYLCQYSAGLSQEIRVPSKAATAEKLGQRKLIGRRAAFELPMDSLVNLGIGLPESVGAVAAEEGLLDHVTLTTEPGVIGGEPQGGLNFGTAVNTDAILDQNQQFDLYDGGGLDAAFLGLAEIDRFGNINVSRFGPKLAGCGGFINISQNARKVLFLGSFMAGEQEQKIENGKLTIVKEGDKRKFVQDVEQVTFSGKVAAANKQNVTIVTERAVFKLTEGGLLLTEIAPGIDLEKDILANMAFRPLIPAEGPKLMKAEIFREEPMGLKKLLLGHDSSSEKKPEPQNVGTPNACRILGRC